MKKNILLSVATLLALLLAVSCATPSTTYINNSTHEVAVFTVDKETNQPAEMVVVQPGELTSLALRNPEYDYSFWVRRRPKEDNTVVFVDKPTSSFHFQNNTSFSVGISDGNGLDFDPFTLAPQEDRIVDTISLSNIYNITIPDNTDPYIIDYAIEEKNNVLIFQWIPIIRYEITGTAQSVDLTYTNSVGEEVTLTDVSLPFEKMYMTFPEDRAEITAKNNSTSGTVILSLYKNGELYREDSSDSPYGMVRVWGSSR